MLHIKCNSLKYRNKWSDACSMRNENHWNWRFRFGRCLWKMDDAVDITKLALELHIVQIICVRNKICTKSQLPFLTLFVFGLWYNNLHLLSLLLNLPHKRIIRNGVESWLDFRNNMRLFHHILRNLGLLQFSHFWMLNIISGNIM